MHFSYYNIHLIKPEQLIISVIRTENCPKNMTYEPTIISKLLLCKNLDLKTLTKLSRTKHTEKGNDILQRIEVHSGAASFCVLLLTDGHSERIDLK